MTKRVVLHEINEKRSKSAKHFLLSDGSYQAIIYSNQVHFETEEGKLEDIDPVLFDEDEFHLINIDIAKDEPLLVVS